MAARPAATMVALPLTGAESIAVPRSAAALRTSLAASSDTVEQSTTTFGAVFPVSNPPGPRVTASRSGDDITVVKTMSQPVRPSMVST